MTRLNIPLFVALAASILSAVPANARDTLPHQRMIRKRGPSIDGPGPVGAAAVIGLHVRQVAVDPTGSASRSSSAAASPSASASSASSSATPSTSSTPTSSAPGSTSTSSSSSAAASTSSGGLLDSISAILGSTSSTSSTAPTSSSVPSTSSTPTPTSTSTSAAQAPQTTPKPAEETPSLNIATSAPAATSRSQSVSVNIIYSTQAAAEASASAEAQKKKTEKITKNTIISLVVIASCIGGAIAIWTVIRKWKLSPSEKFDDRMQPIDWAPPPANGTPEDAIEEKTKHRRAGSGASHGSFTSGGVGQSEQGHGAKGGMYADSQYSHGYGTQPQDFPPPHDFTAGAAQPGYGQYYGGQQYAGGHGYADLQRGPSMSESTYSQGANVSRGLSYSRGHGAYDSQSGAVPPMPNPYGGEYGYDDYNHPPAGQQPQAQGQAPYRAF